MEHVGTEAKPQLVWVRLEHSEIVYGCAYFLPNRELYVRLLDPDDNTKPGACYVYADVPTYKFYDLRNSKAPGRYFAREIRSHHAARRVEL